MDPKFEDTLPIPKFEDTAPAPKFEETQDVPRFADTQPVTVTPTPPESVQSEVQGAQARATQETIPPPPDSMLADTEAAQRQEHYRRMAHEPAYAAQQEALKSKWQAASNDAMAMADSPDAADWKQKAVDAYNALHPADRQRMAKGEAAIGIVEQAPIFIATGGVGSGPLAAAAKLGAISGIQALPQGGGAAAEAAAHGAITGLGLGLVGNSIPKAIAAMTALGVAQGQSIQDAATSSVFMTLLFHYTGKGLSQEDAQAKVADTINRAQAGDPAAQADIKANLAESGDAAREQRLAAIPDKDKVSIALKQEAPPPAVAQAKAEVEIAKADAKVASTPDAKAVQENVAALKEAEVAELTKPPEPPAPEPVAEKPVAAPPVVEPIVPRAAEPIAPIVAQEPPVSETQAPLPITDKTQPTSAAQPANAEALPKAAPVTEAVTPPKTEPVTETPPDAKGAAPLAAPVAKTSSFPITPGRTVLFTSRQGAKPVDAKVVGLTDSSGTTVTIRVDKKTMHVPVEKISEVPAQKSSRLNNDELAQAYPDPKERTAARKASKEFDDLLRTSAHLYDITVEAHEGRNPRETGQMRQAALRAARRTAERELGLGLDDLASPVGRAKALDALKARMQTPEFQTRENEAMAAAHGIEPTTPEQKAHADWVASKSEVNDAVDLNTGDTFTIKGEKYRVVETGDTSVHVKDGLDYWIPFEATGEAAQIRMDKGSLTKPAPGATAEPAPAPPRAKGELFSAEETPFNLAVQQGRDVAAQNAAKAAADARVAAAQAEADKKQLDMFAEPPAEGSGTPAPKAPLVAKTLPEALQAGESVKAPRGATFIRVTDDKGRSIVQPVKETAALKGAGPYAKAEFGIMGKKGFVPMQPSSKAGFMEIYGADAIALARDKTVQGFAEAHAGLLHAYNPGARSADAADVQNILREQLGNRELSDVRRTTVINDAVQQTRTDNTIRARAMDKLAGAGRNLADNYFGKRKQADNHAFMQWMSSGREDVAHPLTETDRALGRIFDATNAEKAAAVQALDTGALQTLRDNYWPGMWTKPSIKAVNQALREAREAGLVPPDLDVNAWGAHEKEWVKTRAAELLNDGKGEENDLYRFMSHAPLEGSKAFTKAKTFDEFQTAVDFGLKPISDNPMDIAALKWHEMDKYIIAHTSLKAAMEADPSLVQLIPAGDKTPDGYRVIDGPYGVVTRPEAGEGKSFRYVARDDVAQVFNNYTSPTLYGNKYVGTLYKAYMSIANKLNQFQLGVGSAFHAGFTSLDVTVSQVANAMMATADGNFALAGKYAADAPLSWTRSAMAGDNIIKQLRGQRAVTAEVAPIIDAMRLSGMKLSPDRQFTGNSMQKMIENFANRQPVRGVARAPFAFVEQAARPIMEWLVPRQKAFAYGEMLHRWMEAHPNANHADLVVEANQIANRIESRLGQVSYTRLMVNNTAKNIVQAGIRAPGWTGGTILEVGGGIADMGRFVRDFATKGPSKVKLTDRAAYTMALLTTVGLANGILTKALTGEDPDWKDFLAFRYGKDAHGNWQRWMLPSYVKDIYAVASRGLADVAIAKTHPALNVGASILRNKDYYGRQIAKDDDSFAMGWGKRLGYGVKQFEPFWIRGLRREQEANASTAAKVLPFFGVMPAPKSLLDNEKPKEFNNWTPAMKAIYYKQKKIRDASRK